MLLTAGALLALSLHLISTGVRPGGIAAAPAALILEIISPFDSAIARLNSGARSIYNNYLALVGVEDDNRRLRAEIARRGVDQTRMTELEAENHHLAELLELRDVLEQHAVATNVIGSDATGASRTMIVSAGTSSGVAPGMAVISNQGVVGKVIQSSLHSSRVLQINDHNSALDGFDQRSRERGIVAGSIDAGVILKYVDRSEDIRTGDQIVTSGLDGIFPRGLLVGSVKSVRREGPGLFLGVIVEPAADFRTLERVMVVTEPPPQPAASPAPAARN